MKIKNKIASIMSIFLIFVIIGVYISTYIYYIQNIKSEENRTMLANINRTKYVLKNEINSLDLISSNFCSSSNIINYINNTRNYTDFFKDSNISALIILNQDKQIKFTKLYNTKDEQINIPTEFLSYINSNKNIFFNSKTTNTIFSLNENPILLCIKPIIDNNSMDSSLKNGIIIMGKYLNKDIQKGIESITDSKLSFNVIKSYEFNDIKKENTFEIISNNSTITTNENIIYGKFTMNGVNNKPLFMISLTSERNIYLRGLNSLKLFIILFIVIITILFLICMKTLRKHIIIPIETICSELNRIKLNTNKFSRISIFENNEISGLAAQINSMLDKIEKDNFKIQDTAKQLTLILQGAEVGYFDYNIKNDSIYINDKFSRILGQTDDIIVCSDTIINYIYKEDKEKFIAFMKKCASETNSNKINVLEIRIDDTNNYKWILIQCKVVEYNNNLPVRVTGILSDITDRKDINEQLHHLAYYDALTGLYNRGFYEYTLEKMNSNNEIPFSIIIGDVNNLKIVNDTWGHDKGDELLKTIARILQSAVGPDAIVARYGGDEFAIIIKTDSEKDLEQLCLNIKQECINKKINSISLNIALGYAIKNNINQDLQQILKEGEERMYRNKVLNDKSVRGNAIASLRQALSEKSNETIEHTNRMSKLCIKIAEKLELSSDDTDKLCLLAQIHDIGKVGITDKILNKPGKLTKEEFEIMKDHTSIGCRIAQTNSDLSCISNEILYHHERWDGTGYPKGLKRTEIPILSRIISVLDSYDVMTHERCYKSTMSKIEAINELTRCSNSQFDPNIVTQFIQIIKEDNNI